MALSPAVLGFVAFLQAGGFTFHGIGLGSDLAAVATRYPGARYSGDTIYVSASASRRETVIQLSGTGPTRRLRISFEARGGGDRAVYPACADIHGELETRYGAPAEVRNVVEEASPRSDRIWRIANEEMTLVCFREPPRRAITGLFAEAIVIVPR